jgi:hypothetical protein
MDMALAGLGHSLVVVLLTLAVVLFPMNLFGFRSDLERDLKSTTEFAFGVGVVVGLATDLTQIVFY